MCIDYRALNKKIVRDRYPLPLIDEQVDQLRDAVIFSTLDLRNGFFHVPMDENSIKYTSFVTLSGQYEFLRTPFGLCISPPVFQRYVNFVFRDIIKAGYLLAYMDDLVVVAAIVDYLKLIIESWYNLLCIILYIYNYICRVELPTRERVGS